MITNKRSFITKILFGLSIIGLSYIFVLCSFLFIVNAIEECERRDWDSSIVTLEIPGEDVRAKCNKAPETNVIYEVGKAFIWPWGEND